MGDILWAGAFESEEQLQEYYAIMGPLYSLKHDPVKAAEGRQRGIRSIDAINEGFGGFLRTYDISDELHKITAPTLVIRGELDAVVPQEWFDEVAAAIPVATTFVVEGHHHETLIRTAEPVADELRRWLEKTQD